MSVFISCGEVSGDLYAADLTEEFSAPGLSPPVWGMVGPRGAAAGAEAVWSYEELKLMGFLEVLPALPRLLRLRERMTEAILRRGPEAVVVIDSPDFHIALARRLRKAGYRGLTVFVATPTVWAWRSGRTRWLRTVFDLCLPLFSFEHAFLAARGVNSRWAAHPLVGALAGYEPPAGLAARYRGARVVALMAGSRRYDVAHHLSQLIETAGLLRSEGRFLPVFSVAPGLSEPLRR